MKNFTEKDEQLQGNQNDNDKKEATTAEEANFNKHQQVDEEGNQVDPEDIK